MSRMLLMQSILGHMALLAEKHPKKAKSAVCKKARAAVTKATLAAPFAGVVAAVTAIPGQASTSSGSGSGSGTTTGTVRIMRSSG